MKRVLIRSTTRTCEVTHRLPSLLRFSSERQQFATSSSSSSSHPFQEAEEQQQQQQQQRHVVTRHPVIPYPQSPRKSVPAPIVRPPYAATGVVPFSFHTERVLLHDAESVARMRTAARLARQTLDLACSLATVGVTTDAIDNVVHEAIVAQGAYPSPLNYAGFPKSLCSSINEVICHGIPDLRPLEFGDVVSFDVSCFVAFDNGSIGVHGDNCATVIVGDEQDTDQVGTDWRGVPYRAQFESPDDEAHFEEARRLVATTREALYAGISACRPGGCLSDIGAAIEDVSDREGYKSVRKYRGHGIGSEFHCAPFVRHYRNDDKLELQPGMIFTIEPMITQGLGDCYEWDDDWTVSTVDGGLAAQFEHTVLITDDGVEILTLPE